MSYPDELEKVLIIGKVWPEPRSSAAGSRMMQLIDYFAGSGFEVTFASAARRGLHSVNLSGRVDNEMQIQLNNSRFDSFIKNYKPDLVLFDRFTVEEQFGWRVAENCPEAIRILDTEDLHFLRDARRKFLSEVQKTAMKSVLQSEMALREIASIFRSDLSLIISVYEMDILLNHFRVPASLLLHLPFMMKPIAEESQKELPGYNERSGFMTIGNFRHPPNTDSVIWLKKEIWPLIRKKLPGVRMNVYGAYLPEKVEMLNAPEDGFYVKGRAESAGAVIKRARVMLAPLRFGAGLKGKLIDAMRYGTPAVITTIGAESMYGSFETPGRVQDDPDKIADAALELYHNENQWYKAQSNGFRIVNNLYNKDKYESLFKKRVDEIWKSLKKHRRGNFTGQMLMHHSMASTRYMSKWIEEKNKKM